MIKNSINNIDLKLNERERAILRSIVNLYIANASPVGSRKLSKFIEHNLSISPATIRNVMVDLEEMELVTHPHTSAGRIPTDKGYRFYVDYLMQMEKISEQEQQVINSIADDGKDSDSILKETSKLLGILSKYLAVVRIPTVKEIKVRKLELIKLSSTHILVVLALESNIVNTVTLEARFEVEDGHLEQIARAINERIVGRNINDLKTSFPEIMTDIELSEKPLIRLFVDSVDKIFNLKSVNNKLFTSGTQNLLELPEFEDIARVKSIIELVENEDIIIHLLDNMPEQNDMQVYIGSEIGDKQLSDYSMIVSNYNLADSGSGAIGLIGPKRMQYNKMLPLVKIVSELLSGKKN
ncbi:MAG: heat-inducible transcriptional repressor HrcA [Candidatus Kapaibacterium sp.]